MQAILRSFQPCGTWYAGSLTLLDAGALGRNCEAIVIMKDEAALDRTVRMRHTPCIGRIIGPEPSIVKQDKDGLQQVASAGDSCVSLTNGSVQPLSAGYAQVLL